MVVAVVVGGNSDAATVWGGNGDGSMMGKKEEKKKHTLDPLPTIFRWGDKNSAAHLIDESSYGLVTFPESEGTVLSVSINRATTQWNGCESSGWTKLAGEYC
jgi:hypothetical protein